MRIFHFNFLFKISKSGLNLAEDTVSEVENILEDVTQNETQNNIFNIQKTKIMASGPITSWQIDGETMETVRNFIFLGSKSTADGDCSHEIKDACSLEEKL